MYLSIPKSSMLKSPIIFIKVFPLLTLLIFALYI